MNKKKPRLYNKEITTYYIHWASKFATMIIKHNVEADYKNWAPLQRKKIILNRDHFQDSSRKVSLAGELLRKLLSKVYYIHWASKFATSDHKAQQRRKLQKLGTIVA